MYTPDKQMAGSAWAGCPGPLLGSPAAGSPASRSVIQSRAPRDTRTRPSLENAEEWFHGPMSRLTSHPPARSAAY